MIKEDAIYRYNKMSNEWCCHGIVYTRMIEGELWALDTYYNTEFKDKHDEYQKKWRCENLDESDLDFVMMIDEAIEIKESEWDLFSEQDRIFIPVGSWHSRYLVNRNATKDRGIIEEAITYNMDVMKSQIKGLTRDIELFNKFIELSKTNSELLQAYDGTNWSINIALRRFENNNK